MNKIFLDKARLKTPTDSVLLVGIVLLVYSLASLAGNDPDKFESELFSNTLVAYINAFIIVFMYWSLFSVVLNFIPNLDDTLLLLFLVLLIRMMKKLYEHQIQMHSADIISYDSETKTFLAVDCTTRMSMPESSAS